MILFIFFVKSNINFNFFFSQAIYWATIFVSVYNLVLIAYERFLAICRPLRHEVFNEKQLKIILVLIYLYSFSLGQAGSYFQVSLNLSTYKRLCIFIVFDRVQMYPFDINTSGKYLDSVYKKQNNNIFVVFEIQSKYRIYLEKYIYR